LLFTISAGAFRFARAGMVNNNVANHASNAHVNYRGQSKKSFIGQMRKTFFTHFAQKKVFRPRRSP